MPPSPPARRRIAVVGNPNVGKSTLFNRLTGGKAHVGNYPGVTVERKVATLKLGGEEVDLVDLPGTYSLSSVSPDERVAMEVLEGRMAGESRPDLVLCVVDAGNLQRNLFLAAQVADLGLPMMVALNLCDEARRHGIPVQPGLLSERLGVPFIATVGRDGEGVEELRIALEAALAHPPQWAALVWPEAVTAGVAALQPHVPGATEGELRRALFDATGNALERLGYRGTSEERHALLEAARAPLWAAGLNPLAAEALLQHRHINQRLEGVERHAAVTRSRHSEQMDALLTHRVAGLLIFFLVMWGVFQSIYSLATPLMDLIESGTFALQAWAGTFLASMPMMRSLVVDGIIGGAGGVVVFLPQIMILFLFISLLEDSGYMARAAFLMDRLFSWCGLSGKSFVPLLSSYACAIPGVMAARTIGDPRARLATILVAPLMSCSARLPVYVLMIGAFIEPRYGPFWGGACLLAMHLVGLVTALPVAALLNRFVLRTQAQPFALEMPTYRWPQPGQVLGRMWAAAQSFLLRAGTIILALSMIVWALLYFPRPPELAERARATFITQNAASSGIGAAEVERRLIVGDGALQSALNSHVAGLYLEQSWMGRFGKAVQPVFDDAGFDWRITVGVVASFPAREVIIATLGIIYHLGSDVDESSEVLRTAMAESLWGAGPRMGQPVFTPATALAIMMFFAFCMQCASTLAVLARESSWGWALFAFTYMTLLAWGAAVLTYQLASRLLPAA